MDVKLTQFNIPTPPVSHRSRLRRIVSQLWWLFQFCQAEARSNARLPLKHTLRAWTYGFSRRSYTLFELDRNDPRLYVTDKPHSRAPVRINGLHRESAKHKVIFSKYVESLGAPSPGIRAVIVKGRIHVFHEADPAAGWPWLRALLTASPPGLVLKPMMGAEGVGVAFLKKHGSGYQLNGRDIAEPEALAVIAQLNDYLITDFVVQHDYAARLYPPTTNTIRLLTFWDYETHSPFLAAAVHRIGTARSYPVDNFKMGAGGLSAPIDLATGRLSRAAYRSDAGVLERHERHPETGNPIEGVCIPYWVETTQQILKFAAQLPYLPFIGWDVVMTSDGYRIIETNPGSGFSLIQVHHPLLADPRVRRFFQAHGLI
jgi:hypothetical protein